MKKLPGVPARMTAAEVVNSFIANNRSFRQKEMNYYKGQQTLEKAIIIAALAKSITGKRHSHQRRIPCLVLLNASKKLLAHKSQLKKCKIFDQLIELIDKTIGNIKGIGQLAVYDIANRIGLYLRIRPQYIYLHSGTREGARKLMRVRGKNKISHKDLPPEFNMLSPDEVEDCLCIYKENL